MSLIRSRRLGLTLLLITTGAASRPLAAQMSDQSFEITTTADSATIGDTVTLHLRLRLSERDLLFDTIPVPVGARVRGVQILSIGRLERGADRVFTGEARVAFYRPGRQEVPQFGIAFARVVAAVERAVLSSQPAWVEIASTLPPGDQPLKDIRPIEQSPAPRWPWLAGLVAATLLYWLLSRFRRRRPARPAALAEAAPDGRNALQDALDQLSAIEQAQWAAQGEPARHYEAVANVVRDYLAETERTPARELTTTELLRALGRGHRKEAALDRCHRVLAEADQVKFAAARPDATAAIEHLTAARQLISGWMPHQNGNGHAPG